MLRHPLCLGLWLAAAPLAAQLPNLATYHPGALHLELSPADDSQLELDLNHLENVLCGIGQDSRLPPGETCRLVISNDGGSGLLREAFDSDLSAQSNALVASPCGSAQVSVVLTGLSVKGAEPLVTSCGSWTFTAQLPANVSPPPSPLTLLPAPAGSPTGLFAGTLSFPLVFVYSHVTSGAAYTETRSMTLDVAGRWTVIQPTGERYADLPASETNLALFVDHEPGIATTWVKRPGCGTARRGCSRLCFAAATLTVGVLNGEAAPVW